MLEISNFFIVVNDQLQNELQNELQSELQNELQKDCVTNYSLYSNSGNSKLSVN